MLGATPQMILPRFFTSSSVPAMAEVAISAAAAAASAAAKYGFMSCPPSFAARLRDISRILNPRALA